MAKVTDENDNLVDVEVSVPLKDMERIFELADNIAQLKVRYEADPLKMANDAIEQMQELASEIAAISGGYWR